MFVLTFLKTTDFVYPYDPSTSLCRLVPRGFLHHMLISPGPITMFSMLKFRRMSSRCITCQVLGSDSAYPRSDQY